MTVCAFIHAWLDDFIHPMPWGWDPPLPYRHYFLIHPRISRQSTQIFTWSHGHGMCAREQNGMMVCSQTQLYGSVHRFMGLIIWTHSHHTSDSYLQLWFLLVPSHYCFGTQNIEIRTRNDYLAGYQAAESFKGHHLTGNRPGTTVYFITEASLFCNSFPVDKV